MKLTVLGGGVVRNRNEVQVIYGVKVGQVRSRVDNWLAEN